MASFYASGFGWQGERIRLVPPDPDRHLNNCYRWLNDPAVTRGLLIGDFPLALRDEKAFFERESADPPKDIVFALELLDGRHLGMSGIHAIDWRSRTATTGSFIGDPDDRRQGYGTEAAILRSRYAFEVINLRMLYSAYLEDNLASARMQSKVGYEICGRFAQRIWKQGRYMDEVMTQMSADQFRALHA